MGLGVAEMSPEFKNLEQLINALQIKCRPDAGPGLWLMFLLPVAILTSAISQPVVTTPTYELSSVFSIGLISTSLLFLYKNSNYNNKKILNILQITVAVVIVGLFRVYLHRGLVFSIWSLACSTIICNKLHLLCLEKLPFCFTIGEAALCTQSYILLLYCSFTNIYNNIIRPATGVMQISTFVLQMGFLCLSTIILVTYLFNVKGAFIFYAILAIAFYFVVLLPGQILLKNNLFVWVIELLWNDIQRNRIVLYWTFCSIAAIVVIRYQIKMGRKASTSIRKVFHLFSVAVFVPGLLYSCTLLYLASGVVLALFFGLEIVRVLNLPPLGSYLQDGIGTYGDEKDRGVIAFTPMYLLSGCALPMWIHPAPCDVADSAILNLLPLLSGILTVGIGDTVASVVGSNFGKYHWPSSKKTIEGTFACILSQLLVILVLAYLDLIKIFQIMEAAKILVVVVAVSILEAKTDQIDNLVLPFVMYILLIL